LKAQTGAATDDPAKARCKTDLSKRQGITFGLFWTSGSQGILSADRRNIVKPARKNGLKGLSRIIAYGTSHRVLFAIRSN
jgi:hypothetical protein